jgi:hypothetical protein
MIEFRTNGHVVSRDQGDVVLSGIVERFFLERRYGRGDIYGIVHEAKIQVSLSVSYKQGGQPPFTATYLGTHAEREGFGQWITWESVVNPALANLVRNVSTDRRLVRALEPVP